MTSTEKILQKAVELVDASQSGKRYSELVKEISATFGDIPVNTVHGALHKFRTELPKTVYQPSRGLYRAMKYKEEGEKQEAEVSKKLRNGKIREEDFYDAFGEWLINELEECTRGIAVGGNRFKDKWGTPDVVGVRESRRSDIIKPPTEIVSAEIKLDPGNLITAFGQPAHTGSFLISPMSSFQTILLRMTLLGLMLCREYSELGWSFLTH